MRPATARVGPVGGLQGVWVAPPLSECECLCGLMGRLTGTRDLLWMARKWYLFLHAAFVVELPYELDARRDMVRCGPAAAARPGESLLSSCSIPRGESPEHDTT